MFTTASYNLNSKTFHAITVIAIATIIVGVSTTMFMAIATTAYLSMATGYWLRKQRNIHVVFMLFAIAIDLSLVLILESNRDAIKTAISFNLLPLQQLHIFMSLIATVLYFPVVTMGLILLKGDKTNHQELLVWHKRVATTAFVFRTLGFLLMFSMISHVTQKTL